MELGHFDLIGQWQEMTISQYYERAVARGCVLVAYILRASAFSARYVNTNSLGACSLRFPCELNTSINETFGSGEHKFSCCAFKFL